MNSDPDDPEITDFDIDFAVILGAEHDFPAFADFPWAHRAAYPPLKSDYFIVRLGELFDRRDEYFAGYRRSAEAGARRKLFPRGDLFLEEGGLGIWSGGEVLVDPVGYDFFNIPYVGWKTVFDLDTGIAAESAAGLHVRFAKFKDVMHLFHTEPVTRKESHWIFPQQPFLDAVRSAYEPLHRFIEAEAAFSGLPTKLTPGLLRDARFSRFMEGLYVIPFKVEEGGAEGPVLDLPKLEAKLPMSAFGFGGFLQGADVRHFKWGVDRCEDRKSVV